MSVGIMILISICCVVIIIGIICGMVVGKYYNIRVSSCSKPDRSAQSDVEENQSEI